MDEPDGKVIMVPKNGFQVNGRVPVAGPHQNNMATRVGQGRPVSGADQNTATALKEDVTNTAKTLGMDVVHYLAKTKKGANGVPAKYAQTLRRTVDELSDRHDILFKGMVTKLGITRQNFPDTFTNIAEEVFRDRQFNWGRVVSVYAFAGRLARHCVENNMQDCVDSVGHLAGDFVAKKLGSWIMDQGGWEAFNEYFPDQRSFDEKVWKGLLFTAVGLGALATMVAVR